MFIHYVHHRLCCFLLLNFLLLLHVHHVINTTNSFCRLVKHSILFLIITLVDSWLKHFISENKLYKLRVFLYHRTAWYAVNSNWIQCFAIFWILMVDDKYGVIYICSNYFDKRNIFVSNWVNLLKIDVVYEGLFNFMLWTWIFIVHNERLDPEGKYVEP